MSTQDFSKAEAGTPSYDVVVIGAGVIGATTARELSRYNASILVLEAGLDIACGATRANSGIVHAGFDPKPGTLKAKYNVEGAALFPQWQRELGFGYYKNGALVLAFDDADRATLENLLARATANGVEGCTIVEQEELRAMEPNVSPDAVVALHAPTSGIVDPYGFTFAAAENAAANGVEFRFDARVTNITRTDSGFLVQVSDGSEIQTRTIVNCAGVHSDEINNMLSERKLSVKPVKGEYLLYHNRLAGTFRHSIFQVPGAAGKGTLVSPVLFGNIFIGPNAQPVDSKDDLSTTAAGQADILERGKRTWPNAPEDQIIATYAGIRATDASGAGDFIIGEAPDVPGLFNAACIDSPGLASSPAIAGDLARMVAERLGAIERTDFNPQRIPAPLLVMMDESAVAKLVEENPAYGVPVCQCCHVSEGEIVAACHRALPPLTVDAIKWRTGATMGPCHGGRCTARIAEIMRRELGVGDIALKRTRGSELAGASASELPDASVAAARQLASEMLAWLAETGSIEAGWGSAGIAGTRPAGVHSALETLELMASTRRAPGKHAVVWGAHDYAIRTALLLADAGVEVECVLESAGAPAGDLGLAEGSSLAGNPVLTGDSTLAAALDERGINVLRNTRLASIAGDGRLSSVEIVAPGQALRTIECDLLVVSCAIVSE